MPRILHGQVIPINTIEVAADVLGGPESAISREVARALQDDLRAFGFLFPDLQNDPNNLLPETPDTRDHLVLLGQTMRDPGPGDETDPGNATIPAIYTYFGQFVDHDVTLEAASAPLPNLLAEPLTPLAMSVITSTLKNLRTATLDLDSVYGNPAPRDPDDNDKMKLGEVTALGGGAIPGLRPPGKDDFNDLPREAPNPDPAHDRAALIGDPRNDENLIVAQLHLAFLRAHNAIVDLDQANKFVKARRILRQHYQHIVLHDFLKRICDPAIVDGILQSGNQVYDPPTGAFFLPLEHAVAAYRFGHTMVRDEYDFNLNFNTTDPQAIPASLALLFTFTALSGEVGFGFPTLPDNWIAQWENLVDGAPPAGMARRLDTMLAEPGLFQLRTLTGQIEAGQGKRLAVRNLLRGYLLRMPTGQAVAGALGITPLTPAQLSAAAGSDEQVEVLDHAGFLTRTPLWYYLLAEAAHSGGNHLGPVGSTLVAEVLIGLVRRSKDSILTDANWTGPTLPSAQAGTFILADLLRLAGVLGDNFVLYTVVAGDTLGSIAQQFNGDPEQWPRIFNANLDQISDPDLIFPGQVLHIPQ